MSKALNFITLLVSFLPFVLFALWDSKSNLKKEIRNKQFYMPVAALVYSIILFVFFNKLGELCFSFFGFLGDVLQKARHAVSDMKYLSFLELPLSKVAQLIRKTIRTVNPRFIILVVFNTLAMLAFVTFKRISLLFFKSKKKNTSATNQLVSVFYDYDPKSTFWYIKPHFGQAKTFLKSAFYLTAFASGAVVFLSYFLCKNDLISVPFYPVFPIILIGELAFYIDGLEYSELQDVISSEIDNSSHVTNYIVLRKMLKELFGDKLSAEGTTNNDSVVRGGSVDQILTDIEKQYGHDGKNYALFIRNKAEQGLVPDPDYVHSGIELLAGKSLLFNTPFYYKLSPYVFYGMNSALLKGGKALIVLGRHGTSDDVTKWCESGIFEVTNLPGLWDIGVLDRSGTSHDIGLVTRSGVHDLELHKANRAFLNKVSFVMLVEPSRLVATAQIGLNLLVRNISVQNKAVYCSVDRNCDGLVDSLSHILMTNITEVAATEYPEGVCSYMCWTADSDYLQHRLTPGISRYLGMGTELSFAALKNQVERTIWYGGEAFPVVDEHWIAKQYYHDLLSITSLPATQETFDKFFKVSYNLCNEQDRDNSYITVEDEFNNLFEVKRELSTISRKQGFVNVISSEYLLREYMTENEEIFNADSKAIPYVSADYAGTKRNIVLKICLQMSIHGILEKELVKELSLLNVGTKGKNLRKIFWNELCSVFNDSLRDDDCTDIEAKTIEVNTPKGDLSFGIDVLEFKHEYLPETGKFEDFYVISNDAFKQSVIDDLQSAEYIDETGNESSYLGSELKGHILQKYLPGQFMTINGKYYEMVGMTSENQIFVRRASDHIVGRTAYRQVRRYHLYSCADDTSMGACYSLNGIKVRSCFAHFSVETPAYYKLPAYNDFENGTLVNINGIPERFYRNKRILSLDFTEYGDAFTDGIRATITLLFNEVFKTMFAENQPYISAVTAGEMPRELTYSIDGEFVEKGVIYILEDSQLDIGLLVSVQRNLERILMIITDYLEWNKEQMTKAPDRETVPPAESIPEEQAVKKKGFIRRIVDWFKAPFGRKNKDLPENPEQDYMMIYGKPYKWAKNRWVRCTQEEFDRRMERRHKIIEENTEKAKEASKAEEATVIVTDETSETVSDDVPEETSGENVGKTTEEVSEAEPETEAETQSETETGNGSEEEKDVSGSAVKAPLSRKEARIAAKAARKAAKEEKKAAKAAKKAEKMVAAEEKKIQKREEKLKKKLQKAGNGDGDVNGADHEGESAEATDENTEGTTFDNDVEEASAVGSPENESPEEEEASDGSEL